MEKKVSLWDWCKLTSAQELLRKVTVKIILPVSSKLTVVATVSEWKHFVDISPVPVPIGKTGSSHSDYITHVRRKSKLITSLWSSSKSRALDPMWRSGMFNEHVWWWQWADMYKGCSHILFSQPTLPVQVWLQSFSKKKLLLTLPFNHCCQLLCVAQFNSCLTLMNTLLTFFLCCAAPLNP